MPKRDFVSPNIEILSAKIKEKVRNNTFFAEKMGKSSGYVTDLKRGKNLPSPEEAARMCVILDIAPEELFETEKEISKVRAVLGIKKDPIAYDEVELDIINDLFSKLTKSNQSLIETMARELLLRQEAETKSPEE